MVFSITWDDSFESIPDDSSYGYDIDTFLNNLKIGVRERAELEHVWKVGATDGQHIPGKIRALLYDTEANILAYSGKQGAIAFSSDSKKVYRNTADGANWSVVDIDHGILSGLGDDDHTIYLKADGTRVLTGNLDANTKKIIGLDAPTDDNDGARKKYVDDQFLGLGPTLYGDYANGGSSLTCDGTYYDIFTVSVVVDYTTDKFFFNGYLYVDTGADATKITLQLYDATTSTELAIGVTEFATDGQIINISCYKTGLTVATHNIKLRGMGSVGGSATMYDRSINILKAA